MTDMPKHTSVIHDIRDKLAEGFFARNLEEVAWKCWRASKNHPSKASLWALAQILLDIAWEWSTRPVEVPEAQRVENELRPGIEYLLREIEDGFLDETMPTLDGLISKYITSITYKPRTF